MHLAEVTAGAARCVEFVAELRGAEAGRATGAVEALVQGRGEGPVFPRPTPLLPTSGD